MGNDTSKKRMLLVGESMGLGLGVPPNETLMEIDGTDGKYHACSNGHIYCFSKARNCARKPSPFRVSSFIGSSGYPFVGTIINGIKRSQNVHAWICQAFHGPKPYPIYCVRHLDGNKANNRPENLAWGSFAQNEADKRRHGTAAIGERQGSAKLTDEAVRVIRASIPFGLWNTTDCAKVFGVTESRVMAIARGIGWKHVTQ